MGSATAVFATSKVAPIAVVVDFAVASDTTLSGAAAASSVASGAATLLQQLAGGASAAGVASGAIEPVGAPGAISGAVAGSGTASGLLVLRQTVSGDATASAAASGATAFRQSIAGAATGAGTASGAVEDPARTIVFAALGQSNMVARASFDSGATHPAGTKQWGRTDPNDGVLIDATIPLQHRDSNAGAQPTPHMGMDITFAIDWVAARPLDTVVFVPSADGGTSINSGFWKKGGTGYEDAVARINACMAANPTFVFGGFLWHQGESDTNVRTAAAYQADLDQVIADFRADVTVAGSTTPFILGELGKSYRDSNVSDPSAADINAVILDTPNRVPYTTAVDTTTGPLTLFDTFHFDAASLRTLGQRYAAAVPVAAARAAAAPAAFVAGDWTLADAASGGTLTLNITGLVDTNGSALTRIEYRVDGGAWTDTGLTAVGTADITGLTDDTEVDVEIRAVNGIGNGAASDTKSATPTENNDVEVGALGHWLLGSDNPTYTGLAGGVLTPLGTAPTLSSGYLSTADGQSVGLESAFNATDEMTVCVVYRQSQSGGTVLAGNLSGANGCGLWGFSNPLDIYLRDRDGANVSRKIAEDQTLDLWFFAAFSVSDAGADEIVFLGDTTASTNISTTAVARTANASKLGIGNTRYASASFDNGADFAEFIIFDSHKTVAELEAIYQRSITRLSGRGVTLE